MWDILDVNETLPEKADAVVLQPLQNAISLENVSFSYGSNKKKILQHIDLRVPKGHGCRSGRRERRRQIEPDKTRATAVRPERGFDQWDGIDIRDATVLSLRKQIALVTQETVLFNDTIRQNIAYGRPEASVEEVSEAAEVAFADEFIEQLPNGYDTVVGERGILLSGGQRQRIAIARAVLVDAPVLILDEATSALDTESETLVQKALANLMENRTSIVIAHRLSTIRKADKIVVLKKGKIVETGTHDELLEHRGEYKKLYELQFADKEAPQRVAL